jgi:hypothetical protein
MPCVRGRISRVARLGVRNGRPGSGPGFVIISQLKLRVGGFLNLRNGGTLKLRTA